MPTPIEMMILAIFALLQIGDGWTTYRVIRSGKGREANPVMRRLFAAIGLGPGLLVGKAGSVVVVVFLWHRHPIIATAIVALLCVIYVWVVANNYRALKR